MEEFELKKTLLRALLPLTLEKFRLKNTIGSLSEQIIDAHYLKFDEFKFALKMYYERAKASLKIFDLDGFNLWVLIITGKGKHNKKRQGKNRRKVQGKLFLEIPKYLASLGLEMHKLNDKQHGGCLYVRLVLKAEKS